MTQTTNPPAKTLRYGSIKAVIWRNPGKDGKPPRYTVNYVRSYTNEAGEWKDTSSFSEVDTLKLGNLVLKVIDAIQELKAADNGE